MATVLAVDVAASSGWCIRSGDGYHSSGQCNAFGGEPLAVCRAVLALDPKARLVLEAPSHGNRATLVGLGAARGCWQMAWLSATGKKKLQRCTSVFPARWRAQLFGAVGNFPLREKLHAQLVSKRMDTGSDENAAICIASWAVSCSAGK